MTDSNPYAQADVERLNRVIAQQKQRLENDYRTIRGLASGYDTLHLFDMDTGRYTPFFVENNVLPEEEMVMTGYDDFYSAHAAYVETLCHPDFRRTLMKYTTPEQIREALRGKKTVHERVLVKKDASSWRWIDFVLIKFDDQKDEAHKIAIGYTDVDDVVHAEQDHLRVLEEARMSEKAGNERYNFLVNVAHELRTPITLIVGPLRRCLRTEPMTQKTSSTINRACQQADKMTNLLNTILTTNKIEEGAEKAHPEPVDMNDWVSVLADEFRDEADGHGMQIKVFTDPTITKVDMDVHLCNIVFSNLMVNAMRHNKPGAPIIVSTKWNDSMDAVRISVTDNGSGIGDIDVSKLFERYYRDTEEKTGFGIGLSYSKTIIDAHGGRIGAYNNLGNNGATFWFELPADNSLRAGSTIVAQAKDHPALNRTGAPAGLRDKVILYAEDDKDLREYMETEMEGACRKLITAFNGRRALEIMSQEPVDILITDVMMPELDGLALCHLVKSTPRFRDIPVIMLSARADVESIRRGYDAKADFYMDKPFEIDRLFDILENKLNL